MKAPAMKTPALATVYLDNEAIGLMGDPRPRVSKIVVAGGKRPESVQVVRTESGTDQQGKPVGLDEVIDRTTEPARPIYLTCKPRAKPVPSPSSQSSVAAGALHTAPTIAIEAPSTDGAGPRPLGSRLAHEPEAERDP